MGHIQPQIAQMETQAIPEGMLYGTSTLLEAFLQNNGVGTLPVFILAAVQAGIVNSEEEGIRRAVEILSRFQPNVDVLTKYGSHYSDNWHPQGVRELINTIHRREGEKVLYPQIIASRVGAISHECIANLLTGNLAQYPSPIQTSHMQSELPGFESLKCNSIFDSNPNIYEDAITRNNSVSDKHLELINDHRLAILAALSISPPDYWRANEAARELAYLLMPIFHIVNRKQKNPIQEILRLTHSLGGMLPSVMMNLANAAVAYYGTDAFRIPRAIFAEVPVLSQPGVRAGRADLVEVVAINGRKPSSSEIELIRAFAKTARGSLGSIHQKLKELLGADITWEISDNKFAIGDNNPRFRHLAIPRDAIANGPFGKHEIQVKAYHTLATVDVAMVLNDMENPFGNGAISCVHLLYRIGDTLDEAEKITFQMSSEEMREFFRIHYGNRHSRAELEAVFRMWGGVLLAEARRYLGVSNIVRRPKESPESTGQMPLINDETTGKFTRLIEESREFYHPEKLERLFRIEGRRRSGEPKLVMDYNLLLQLIVAGKIQVSEDFGPLIGGFIHCPLHEFVLADQGLPPKLDESPSFHIFGNGRWHCFSCNAGGSIDPTSFPPGWKGGTIKVRTRKSKRQHAITNEMLDESQVAVLNDLFLILQEIYKSSTNAQNYLQEIRGLTPEILAKYGVGYWPPGAQGKILEKLIEQGYTMEDIDRAGIRVLVKPKRYRDEEGNVFTSTPYYWFPLNGTVVFKIGDGKDGDMNLYGRNAYKTPKSLWRKNPRTGKPQRPREHWKLQTKVPHGVFNQQVLNGEIKSKKVVVFEAVIDALSYMILTGEEDVVAIIGTLNHYAVRKLKDLALQGVQICLALDNDSTGQLTIKRIIAELESYGCGEMVFNYTEILKQLFQELSSLKDLNEVLLFRIQDRRS